ncbi:MAG: sugar phosphate isomerase/epimerase [Clostridia bacterium]|nr:sugar phosphate isomerase/epimerase [Clostridia bacterium]MBQ3860961.1 sugar phosphate isomerase/epimerase [Clostridia bacterium]MBQ3957072.1 sugar phosphate isomerase/epimerase [Clostridia bacterium]MBQ5354337.1 sugar phosphate isomerase/epimerase [Clostridia bacterium]
MKKSLNAWTVDGSLGMEAMFEAVSRAGFDGIELNVDRPGGAHALSMETTKEELAGIRALSEKYSLPVVSISTSLSGGMSGIPERWGEYRRLLRKQIEIAKALGASGILTVPGGMGGDITLKTARENSIAFYRSVRDEIEESGIFVGLENVWNGFFLSPFDMTSMLEEIGSKKIGAYFDAGNMLAFSVSEYWAEVLAGWIGCVHVKDYKRAGGINSGGEFVDITHGSANWKAIVPALKKGGFDGYLTGEVGKSDPDMSWDDYYKKVAGEIGEIIQYE